jgi:hypothetical protein
MMKLTTYERSFDDDECMKTNLEATLVSEEVCRFPLSLFLLRSFTSPGSSVTEKTWPWY